MLTPIIDHREIVSLLKGVGERLSEQFKSISLKGDLTYFDGFKLSERYTGYGLKISTGPKRHWNGLELFGPDLSGSDERRNLLGFYVRSPNTGVGRTASLIAVEKQESSLFHTGKVYTRDGRGRPFSRKIVEIDDRQLYFVSRLNDRRFFEKIVDFHLSRLNDDLARNALNSPTNLNKGFDPGVSLGGTRRMATFEARHHPIAIALKEQLERLGYRLASCDTVTPDLLVKKKSAQFLFEIKPEARPHDLMLACGQVLVYGFHLKADRRFIVSKELKKEKLGLAIAKFLEEQGIKYIPYIKDAGQVKFPNLSKQLEL